MEGSISAGRSRLSAGVGAGASHLLWRLLVVVAVGAQDVAAVGEEARTHQRHGTARALEARLVPLPLLKGDVLAVSEAYGKISS